MSSKNHHILNSSSNLLGFSLLAITTIHTTGIGKGSLVDELAGLQILFFTASAICSFLSMRASKEKSAQQLEDTADVLFLFGLVNLLVVVIFFTISFS